MRPLGQDVINEPFLLSIFVFGIGRCDGKNIVIIVILLPRGIL
jgi:hypothetical protein